MADKLAKEVVGLIEGTNFMEWTAPPVFVMKTMNADKEGAGFARQDMPLLLTDSLALARNLASYVVSNQVNAEKEGTTFARHDMPPLLTDNLTLAGNLASNIASNQVDCNASGHRSCIDANYV